MWSGSKGRATQINGEGHSRQKEQQEGKALRQQHAGLVWEADVAAAE